MRKNKPAEPLNDLLFEIGTEELPATSLADVFESSGPDPAVNVFRLRLKQVFESHRVAFAECDVWATPRRLVFWVRGVAPTQSPKDNWTRLLPKQEAYSEDGKPSEKFSAILKHRNISAGETAVSDFNGKEFVFLKKSEPVLKTSSVLPEILEALVRSLPFPKMMKWDDSGIYFPRPIRSYLCLYGVKAPRFKIGNLPVADQTFIFLKSKRNRYTVKDRDAYFQLLRKQGVILNPSERKKAVRQALEASARSLGGKLYEDAFLLNEVNFLCENPQVLSGSFDERFLELPFEVLTASMARKQRIFSLLDKSGRLLPGFLAVLDGAPGDRDAKAIAFNYEQILRAKLQDSLFFYKEDLKVSLERKTQELGGLIFLKGAGSMRDKSERLFELAKKIGPAAGLSEPDQRDLQRACHLCKSDLLSHMVGEFPELQGIMGKYYALENGESRQTAQAIGEQYLPRTVQDRLPETLAGSLLSLLDKCDLIVACFGLGLEPSSSLDPYALRRSATAALKILLEKKIDLSLCRMLEESQRLFERAGEKKRVAPQELTQKLQAFFRDRFKAFLTDKGYREDLVEAALASGFDRPYEAYSRIDTLGQFLGERPFLDACKVVERTANILKGNRDVLPEAVDRSLFTEPLEEEVFKRYQEFRQPIQEAKKARDFRHATNLYADAFFDILERFFEKVFINAEDKTVRRNRLAMLQAIKELYTGEIADLSMIRASWPQR